MSEKSGFSLVELIIVIGIMGILTGLAALGLGYLNNADAKKCTNSINSSLGDLKSQNMAKNKPIYMHLSSYDGNYFIEYTNQESYSPAGNGEQIGSASGITITYGDENKVLSEGMDLCFCIRKKDGAFTIGTNKIEISGSSDYTIRIVMDTGRHYIE